MCGSLLFAPIGAALFLLLASATTAAERQAEQTGKELFERNWTENDAISPSGDGLGPMFNARSCIACHNQGGVGGGGANDRNVDLLTVDRAHDRISRSSTRTRAACSTALRKRPAG